MSGVQQTIECKETLSVQEIVICHNVHFRPICVCYNIHVKKKIKEIPIYLLIYSLSYTLCHIFTCVCLYCVHVFDLDLLQLLQVFDRGVHHIVDD